MEGGRRLAAKRVASNRFCWSRFGPVPAPAAESREPRVLSLRVLEGGAHVDALRLVRVGNEYEGGGRGAPAPSERCA